MALVIDRLYQGEPQTMTRARSRFDFLAILCVALSIDIVVLAGFTLPVTADEASSAREDSKTSERALKNLAEALDQAEGHVQEWGIATVAEALVIKDTGLFKNGYSEKADTYVQKARSQLQGGVSHLFQQAFDSQTTVKFSEPTNLIDAAAAVAEAASDTGSGEASSGANATAAGSATGGGSGVTAGTDGTSSTAQVESASSEEAADEEAVTTASAATRAAQNVLSSPRFSEAGALLGSQSIGIPESTALKIGLSDKLSEQLLGYLVHPQDVPSNKRIFLGLLQVSVDPGWRTTRGYIADVSVTTEYRASTKKVQSAAASELRSQACLEEVDGSSLSHLRKNELCTFALKYPKLYAMAYAESVVLVGAATAAAAGPSKPPKKLAVPTIEEHFGGWSESDRRALAALPRDLARELRSSDLWIKRCKSQGQLGSEAECADAFELTASGRQNVCRLSRLDRPSPDDQMTLPPGFRNSSTAHLRKVCDLPETPMLALPFRSYDAMGGHEQPMVASVFPLLEAQVLDLESAYRNQVAVAAQIAATFQAAGLDIAAESINDYVKRLESDAATRSTMPVVSAYSNGTSFGYRVRPALAAVGDPRDISGRPDLLLQPISFPVLILLVADAGDLERYDEIVFSVNTRWQRVQKRHWAKLVFVDWWLHGGRRFPPYRASDQILLAQRLGDSNADFKTVREHSGNPIMIEEARRRHRNLTELAIGLTRFAALPDYSKPSAPADVPAPKLDRISPGRGWYNADTTFVITGDYFQVGKASTIRSVTIGGRPCTPTVVDRKTLLCVLPKLTDMPPSKGSKADEVEIVVTTHGGTVTGDSKKSPISVEMAYLPRSSRDVEKIGVTYDAAGRVVAISTDSPKGLEAELIRGATRKERGRDHTGQTAEIELSVKAQKASQKNDAEGSGAGK